MDWGVLEYRIIHVAVRGHSTGYIMGVGPRRMWLPRQRAGPAAGYVTEGAVKNVVSRRSTTSMEFPMKSRADPLTWLPGSAHSNQYGGKSL